MILAIETATQICSVALQKEDGSLMEKRSSEKGVHSETLFLFLEQLIRNGDLKPEKLEEVLISSGPGTYTGLRIGAACVKGFLFGKKTPLFKVGTLAGFAAPFICRGGFENTLHAVLDARREHLYYQRFHLGSSKLEESKNLGENRELPEKPDLKNLEISAPSIKKISDIDRLLKSGDLVTGTGLKRLHSYGMPGIRFHGEASISAKNLILARKDIRFEELFTRVDVSEFEPEYLAGS